MADVYGFLINSGISGFNSLLLVTLFMILRAKFNVMEERLSTLWDWHLMEKGAQRGRRHNDEEGEDS